MKQGDLDNAFQFVVSAIKSASGGESSIVEFRQVKDYMLVSAKYNEFSVSFKVESKAEKWNSAVSVDSTLLPKAFKGDKKADIELSINQNASVLQVKKKGFLASYNAVSFEHGFSDVQREYKDVSETLPILSQSVRSLSAIKTLVDYSKYIRVSSNGSIVSCGTGDSYHLTFSSIKAKIPELDYCIPFELARLISLKDIESLQISTGHLLANGKLVRIETNLVAPNKVIDLNKSLNFINTAEEARFSLNPADCLAVLQTLNVAVAKTVILTIFSNKKPSIAVKSPEFEAKGQIDGSSIKSKHEVIKIELNSKNFVECLSAFEKNADVVLRALPNAISMSSDDSRLNSLIVANRFNTKT